MPARTTVATPRPAVTATISDSGPPASPVTGVGSDQAPGTPIPTPRPPATGSGAGSTGDTATPVALAMVLFAASGGLFAASRARR
jgi:hypothetical protein